MNIQLVVDGIEIELNDFVRKMLGNVIIGAMSSLHDVQTNWKEIQIRLTK